MTEKKRIPAKKLSFSDAVTEVEEILDRLEGDDIDIDDLSVEVGRAVELIKVCRTKLEKTDQEVRTLVADLQVGEAETTVAKDGAVAADAGAVTADAGAVAADSGALAADGDADATEESDEALPF